MNTQEMPQIPPPPLPLTTPDEIAQALDLFITPRERARGALLVLLCDDERRAWQPLLIEDLRSMPPDTHARMLNNLAEVLTGAAPSMQVLVAIARPGLAEVTPTDVMWRREILDAFEGKVLVFEMQLVTPFGSTPLTELDDLAA